MQTVYYNRQLAVKLNEKGMVIQVITNSFADIDVMNNSLFMSLIDPDYHNRYLKIFSSLSSDEIPLGIQLRIINKVHVYFFMSRLDNEISVFAMEIEKDAEALFDEILKINTMHVNSLRELSKKLETNTETKDLFEEIMMLNSTLVNTRRELSIKNMELEKLNSRLEGINYIDFLTQIFNRRKFFNDIYKRVIYNDLLLIMMDFNNFKLINDEFGHKRGDEALIFFSQTMSELVKEFDGNLYRLGGDEFAILVRDNSNIDIEKLFIEVDSGLKEFHSKVSMAYGCVVVTKETCNKDIPAEESMKIADRQMYLQKNKKMKKI